MALVLISHRKFSWLSQAAELFENRDLKDTVIVAFLAEKLQENRLIHSKYVKVAHTITTL
jgi:hypothetical protein